MFRSSLRALPVHACKTSHPNADNRQLALTLRYPTFSTKYFKRQAVDRYIITFLNPKGQTMMISVRRYQTRRNLTMATQGCWSAFAKGKEKWGSSTPATSLRTSKSSLTNLILCAETRSFLWSRKIFSRKAATWLRKALRYINILVSFVNADISRSVTQGFYTRRNSCCRASDSCCYVICILLCTWWRFSYVIIPGDIYLLIYLFILFVSFILFIYLFI